MTKMYRALARLQLLAGKYHPPRMKVLTKVKMKVDI